MSQMTLMGSVATILHVLIQAALVVRVLLRPHREPASRIAWIVVNILFYDRSLTADMRERQDNYFASARPVTSEMVTHWTWRRRLGNNAIAMLGPVL